MNPIVDKFGFELPTRDGAILVAPSRLVVRNAAETQIRRPEWAIPDYLAKGSLTVLAGQKASGKSSIYAAMAAGISRRIAFPLGQSAVNEPHNGVLIFSSEDNWESTILPRLKVAGADLTRISNIDGVEVSGGNIDPYTFEKKHNEHILQNAKDLGGISLIIVDPWTLVINYNENNTVKIQRTLERLTKFAKWLNVAILLTAHVKLSPKGLDPVSRISGNASLVRVCRSLLLVAKNENGPAKDGSTHILVRAVTNIGVSGGGWSYHIEGADVGLEDGPLTASKIVWDTELHDSPEEILAKVEAPGRKKQGEVDHAADYLTEALRNGPRLKSELVREAKMLEISESALIRAKKVLGILHEKMKDSGQASPFVWFFPAGVLPEKNEPILSGQNVAERPNIASDSQTPDVYEI